MLSSDILERQFGPTVVEVLQQDDRTRLICTKVVASGQVLEMSLVTFIEAGMKAFPSVHTQVVAGESMGKAFRAAGISFVRQTTATYKQTPQPEFQQRFQNTAPATIVEVTILVGPDRLPYATILETYSPAVDWPSEDC